MYTIKTVSKLFSTGGGFCWFYRQLWELQTLCSVIRYFQLHSLNFPLTSNSDSVEPHYITSIGLNLSFDHLRIRTIGSAALSCCMVAQGVTDAYIEYEVHCWDYAAGDIIVREAGGVALYPTG